MAAKRWVNTRLSPKKAGDKVEKKGKETSSQNTFRPVGHGKVERVLGNPGERINSFGGSTVERVDWTWSWDGGPLWTLGAQVERPGLFHGTGAVASGSRAPCKLPSRPGWSSTMRECMETCIMTVSTELAPGLSQNVLKRFSYLDKLKGHLSSRGGGLRRGGVKYLRRV